MIVRAKLSALKQGHWYEYLVRFALDCRESAVAGLVADIWGPAWFAVAVLLWRVRRTMRV